MPERHTFAMAPACAHPNHSRLQDNSRNGSNKSRSGPQPPLTRAFPLPRQARPQQQAARHTAMSSFAGQRSRPWVGMAGVGTASEPAGDSVARDDATAASSMRGAAGADASTNSSAISFGFAATAVLVSMFLLMAIFEHLIKPGLASSRRSSGDDSREDAGDGRGLPLARLHHHPMSDAAAPYKLSHSPQRKRRHSLRARACLQQLANSDMSSMYWDYLNIIARRFFVALQVEEPVAGAADLTVLMPGQRYPTFLAQPAPLAPWRREGHGPSYLPP
ncbi:hypothetical protein HU200_002720 [Digitaria exilis]|uniref:Uncharacterized protein n=1 Tax=Digitaria exilis TaxID=1010633 RepID=A0A835FZ76_9POAL|nr:hypothetical protein HU200_002720 [Digitaria exilis]